MYYETYCTSPVQDAQLESEQLKFIFNKVPERFGSILIVQIVLGTCRRLCEKAAIEE